jgi:hypothetical protein
MNKLILIALIFVVSNLTRVFAQSPKTENLGVFRGETYEYRYTKMWNLEGTSYFIIVERTDSIENEKDYLSMFNGYYYIDRDSISIRYIIGSYMAHAYSKYKLRTLSTDILCHLSGAPMKVRFRYNISTEYPDVISVEYFEQLEKRILSNFRFIVEEEDGAKVPEGMNVEGLHFRVLSSLDVK